MRMLTYTAKTLKLAFYFLVAYVTGGASTYVIEERKSEPKRPDP